MEEGHEEKHPEVLLFHVDLALGPEHGRGERPARRTERSMSIRIRMNCVVSKHASCANVLRLTSEKWESNGSG